MPKPIIQNKPSTGSAGNTSAPSSQPVRKSTRSMSEDTFKKYDDEYKNWKKTGKYSDGFSSWMNQEELDLYKNIKSGNGRSARSNGSYYYMDNDTYDKYGKEYANWKSTNKYSDDFASWKNDDDLNAYKAIRGSRSQQDNAFDDFRYSLNNDVLKAVQDKYRSQWGDKYYYDITDADDLARMNAGQMPKYLANKYKENDSYDQWLYENNLPSTSDFNDMYSQAVLDYNEQQQTRSGQLQNIINSLDQFDQQRAAFLQGSAQGKTPEEMLATGNYDAFVKYYGGDKEEDNPYKARQDVVNAEDYTAYDNVYNALYSGDPEQLSAALNEGFWDKYTEKNWQKYLNQKLKWNEDTLEEDIQRATDHALAVQASVNSGKLSEEQLQNIANSIDTESLEKTHSDISTRKADIDSRVAALKTQPRLSQEQYVELSTLQNESQTMQQQLDAVNEQLMMANNSENQLKLIEINRDLKSQWNDLSRRSDFAEKSASIDMGSLDGSRKAKNELKDIVARTSDAANVLEKAKPAIYSISPTLGLIAKEVTSSTNSRNAINKWMSDDERAMFNYIANTQGADAAIEYTERIRPLMNERSYQAELAQRKGMMDTTTGTIGLNIARPFMQFEEAKEGLLTEITAATGLWELEYHDPRLKTTRLRQGILADTGEQILKATADEEGNATGWGQVLNTVYNMAQSTADNAVRQLVFGSIPAGGTMSALSMSGSVMGSTLSEYMDKGASAEQALTLAFVNAVAEGIGEKFTFDKYLHIKDGNAAIKAALDSGQKLTWGKYLWHEMSSTAVAEAGEEIITEIIDKVMDTVVMGDQSELKQIYDSVKAKGGTDGQAWWEVIKSAGIDIGMAGLGGMFSGVILGGGNMALSNFTKGRAAVGSVKGAMKAGREIALRNANTEAKLMPTYDEAYGHVQDGQHIGYAARIMEQMAEEYREALADGGTVDSAVVRGRVIDAITNATTLTDDQKTAIIDAYEEFAASPASLLSGESKQLLDNFKSVLDNLDAVASANGKKARIREIKRQEAREKFVRDVTPIQQQRDAALEAGDRDGYLSLAQQLREANNRFQHQEEEVQLRDEIESDKELQAEKKAAEPVINAATELADAIESEETEITTELYQRISDARGADQLDALGEQLEREEIANADADYIDDISNESIEEAKLAAMEKGDERTYNLLEDMLEVKKSGDKSRMAEYASKNPDIIEMMWNADLSDAVANDGINNIQEEMVNANTNGRNGQSAEAGTAGYADEVSAFRQGRQTGDLDQRADTGELQGYSGEQGESGRVQEAVRRSAADAQRRAEEAGQGRIVGKIHSWTKDKLNQLNNAIQSVNKDVRAQGTLKEGDLTACDPNQLTEQSRNNVKATERYTGVDESFFYNLAKAAGIELDGITPGDKAASFIRNMGGHVMEIFAKAHEDAHRVKTFRDAVHNIMMGFDQDVRGDYFQNYLGIRNVDLGGITYEQAAAYNTGEADINEGLEGLSEQERRETLQQRQAAADMAEEFQCDVVGAYVLYKATDGSMLGWDQLGMGPKAAAYFTLLSDVLNGQSRNADSDENTEVKAFIMQPDSARYKADPSKDNSGFPRTVEGLNQEERDALIHDFAEYEMTAPPNGDSIVIGIVPQRAAEEIQRQVGVNTLGFNNELLANGIRHGAKHGRNTGNIKIEPEDVVTIVNNLFDDFDRLIAVRKHNGEISVKLIKNIDAEYAYVGTVGINYGRITTKNLWKTERASSRGSDAQRTPDYTTSETAASLKLNNNISPDNEFYNSENADKASIRPPTGLTRTQRAQMYQWDRERLDNQLRNMKASERAAVLREREKMQQRQDREKYGNDVVKRSRDLMKWMTSPNVKEGKYVPDFFKDAVSEVLQGIDLGSNDRVGGQKVQSWRRSLMNLATTLQQYKAHQEGRVQDGRFEGMEMDLPDGFVEDFTDLANSITEEGTNFLQDMDADRLRRLDKSIAILQSGIRNANRMHANARYATVSDAAESTIQEQEGRRKYKDSGIRAVEAVRSMVNSEMLDLESYAQRLGDAGGSVVREIANGFLKGTTHIKEAQEFFENAREKDGITKKDVHSWTKNTVTQQLESGETISMTEGQLMNLYALSARQQAMSHILQGGIELAYNKSSKGNQNRAYQLTYGDLDNLFSHLSDKQKRFVTDLQRYLSETASGWGNEVSQELYGIDMYGEEFYWPIRSAKAGLATQDPEKVRAFNAIQNSSFTNAVIRNASNPVMLDDCVQTFCDHVAQMANYNGMAVPIGDAMKWFNYKSRSDDGATDWNRSVKRSITDVMGKDGTSYFINLIKDINGLSEGGTGTNLPSALVANTKKAAVAAKIRVMIQQPTAVVRAMSMINPKYFAGFDDLHLKDVVNEMQENAPIAWWKAQGNFDIGTGKSMRDIISGDASAYENFVNATMAGAGAMDDLGWSWIWNAVKREQKFRHPSMTDEQLMPAIVDRFTDVINKTQVIDTVVHRSQIMRSKDSAVKQSTAFMSEPIKTFNLLHNALNDVIEGRPGAKKRLGRTAAAVAGSWALNAAVLALHDALKYRDDDDDLWDLIQQYWKDNFISNFNQLNAIPYIKDVLALAQGEKLERMDMSAIGDLIDSAQAIGKYLSKGETTYTGYGLTRKFMTALGNVFGTPLTGLLADAELVVNAVAPGSVLTKKTKNWDKADVLIEQGISKKQARGLMKNYDASTNGTKALSILTYDGNKDGKPDFDKQQQDMIAEILGISYSPEKDGSLEEYARKSVDSYLKKKEKDLDKGKITEEKYEEYKDFYDYYFELLG